MAARQAVEAKEGLEVKGNSDTVGSITFQMLFKYFPKLAGMTVRCPVHCGALPPEPLLRVRDTGGVLLGSARRQVTCSTQQVCSAT